MKVFTLRSPESISQRLAFDVFFDGIDGLRQCDGMARFRSVSVLVAHRRSYLTSNNNDSNIVTSVNISKPA